MAPELVTRCWLELTENPLKQWFHNYLTESSTSNYTFSYSLTDYVNLHLTTNRLMYLSTSFDLCACWPPINMSKPSSSRLPLTTIQPMYHLIYWSINHASTNRKNLIIFLAYSVKLFTHLTHQLWVNQLTWLLSQLSSILKLFFDLYAMCIYFMLVSSFHS